MAPLPGAKGIILIQVSKHQGSPGTCRFGISFHIQASGPRIGSSEYLIQSTWSCQGCPCPCLGSASLLPRGLSWLPAAQHSTNPWHVLWLQPAALGRPGGISHGGSRSWQETQEMVLSLVLSESPLPSVFLALSNPRISIAAGTLLRCRKHWRPTCHSFHSFRQHYI